MFSYGRISCYLLFFCTYFDCVLCRLLGFPPQSSPLRYNWNVQVITPGGDCDIPGNLIRCRMKLRRIAPRSGGSLYRTPPQHVTSDTDTTVLQREQTGFSYLGQQHIPSYFKRPLSHFHIYTNAAQPFTCIYQQ